MRSQHELRRIRMLRHHGSQFIGSVDVPEFQMICIRCRKTPEQMAEYTEEARELGVTPREYVRMEEGTYNSSNGHFVCTPCYLAMGAPSSPKGWVAP